MHAATEAPLQWLLLRSSPECESQSERAGEARTASRVASSAAFNYSRSQSCLLFVQLNKQNAADIARLTLIARVMYATRTRRDLDSRLAHTIHTTTRSSSSSNDSYDSHRVSRLVLHCNSRSAPPRLTRIHLLGAVDRAADSAADSRTGRPPDLPASAPALARGSAVVDHRPSRSAGVGGAAHRCRAKPMLRARAPA